MSLPASFRFLAALALPAALALASAPAVAQAPAPAQAAPPEPRPAGRAIELHIHLLIASRDEAPGSPLPAELKPVVDTLRTTLAFRSYGLIASLVQRTMDGGGNLSGTFQAPLPGSGRPGLPADFRWRIRGIRIRAGQDGAAMLEFNHFGVQVRDSGKDRSLAELDTDFSMKAGDRVVVGTTSFQDQALIVLVTAKVAQ